MRLFAVMTDMKFTFLLILTFISLNLNAQENSDHTQGNCLAAIEGFTEKRDTTYHIFYTLKSTFVGEKIKVKRKRLLIDSEIHIQLNRLHPDQDSTLWSKDIFDKDTLVFNTVKKPHKVESYKLDTIFLELITYRISNVEWIRIVCGDPSEELLSAVVDFLFQNDFLVRRPYPLDGYIKTKEFWDGLVEYQKKHDLKYGVFSFETLEHMNIDKSLYDKQD